jgi:hypothetical protein
MAGVPGDHRGTPSLDLNVGVQVWRRDPLDQHPPNRRRSEAAAGTSQHARHALVAHGREQTLQLSDEIPDEIRVAVDRLDGSDKGSFPVLVEPTHPDQERLQIDEEDLCGPLQGPAASCPNLQDPHALAGNVVRPAPGSGPFPATVLDAEFLPEQRDLTPGVLELDSKPTVRLCAATGM